jgi:predicted nucleic acid-binding protein
LSEYHEVLKGPKFHFDPDKVASVLDYIEHSGWVVSSAPLSASLPDPDDEPFLEIAISGNADHVVTGNAIHFPYELCQRVKVVSPSDFLKRAVKQKRTKKKST